MSYVDLAFGETGLLSKLFPGFTPREQQVELARAIEQAVTEGTTLLAEAPTGVGKSFAGLIPAAEVILTTQRPVVVVTSSILLQEQYINKDIPFLESVVNTTLDPVLIKGRNNYLCLLKAGEQLAMSWDVSDSEMEQRERIEEWMHRTETGDMSELPFHPSYLIWSQFAATDDHECLKKSCAFYDQCYYYKQRKKVLTSKLVVCNYHYYFTALKAGPESGMLPANAKLTIFDEGHEMAGVARNFLEKRFSYRGIKHSFSRLQSTLKKKHDTFAYTENIDALFSLWRVDDFLGEINDAFMYTNQMFPLGKKTDREYVKLEPESARLFSGIWENAYAQLRIFATRVAQAIRIDVQAPDQWALMTEGDRTWTTALQTQVDVLHSYADLLNLCFQYDARTEQLSAYQDPDFDLVKWIAMDKENNPTFHIKPSIAAPFTEDIFQHTQDAAQVVLSATLSTNKSFEHVKRDLGVANATELMVSSPFELSQNLLWYLPDEMPAGNDPLHIDRVVEEIAKVATALGGKTLALFTSIKNLNYAKHQLSRLLPYNIQILAQGDDSRERLVQRMRNEGNIVLLGTRSLFTGIDIPGPNLSAVLLDKIPFPMMGEPVNDHLMSKPTGFGDFTIPETIMTLKQAFGRLNRTATDFGVVAVMDGRLSTARYKNQIFNSFDFQIQATRSAEKVEAYLKRGE